MLEINSIEVNGKIYCMGGWNGGFKNVVEVYDPITNSWETRTSMPNVMGSFGIAEVNNKIYLIGGEYGSSSYPYTIEVYDTVTDSWDTNKRTMPSILSRFGSVEINGKIYCIGGKSTLDSSTISNKVLVYDTGWRYE